MKKLIFILFLFTCIKASAQIPIRSLTNVADKSLYVDNHFTPPRYDDTTQANLNLGLDSCGAIIYTRSDQKLWKRVCSPTKHWEEIGSGSGGSGSVEYVKPGRYTLVDSVGRNYTINVDTAGLFTIIRQEIHDSISGINLADTIYTKQPLYVDAGVKDTLKLNADSSGLVRDVMRSNDSVYIKINGVWEFAFIDSVGSGGGGGSVEYVLQGWGTKVDSVGRNYTVGVDSLLLVTPHDLDSAINTIDTSLLVHKAGKEIITGSKEFQDSLVILNPNNATSGTDLFDAPRFKLSSSGWNSALSAPVRQNVYIRHVPTRQNVLSDSAKAGTIYFSSKTGLQARPTPYDGAYITLDGNWGTTLGIVGGSYMNVNTVASSTLSGSNISLGFGALTCTQNDNPTSGNFNLSKIKRTGIITTTPSYTTTSKFIEYNMEINNTNANTMVVRGFEFNPILTNTTNTDLKAIVTTAGDSYFNTSSGAIGVGVSGTINSSAKLEVASTTKGFLPPRMAGSQAEAIASKAEGLIIYSTDGSGSTITSKGWWGYDGATWVKLN